jgi:hypothetical protein
MPGRIGNPSAKPAGMQALLLGYALLLLLLLLLDISPLPRMRAPLEAVPNLIAERTFAKTSVNGLTSAALLWLSLLLLPSFVVLVLLLLRLLFPILLVLALLA